MSSYDDVLSRFDAATEAETPRYRLLTADQLRDLPDLRWRVKGVLPATGLAGIYGAAASGKTFLALSIAAAVADGAEWFDCRVEPAPVVYVALEGEAGIKMRVAAWEAHHQRPLPDGMRLVLQPFRLTEGEDIVDLANVIPDGSVVFIDTLNRAAPTADENSSRDMGGILEASKALQALTGGLVVLVHHTGKDGTKGLRGHSSLLAALDAAVEVTRDDDRRSWKVAKAKDGIDGECHPFKLRVVELGTDDYGDPVTSCAVEPDDTANTVAKVKLPQGGNQKLIFDALRTLLAQQSPFDETYPPCVPAGQVAVELEAVLPDLASCLTCEERRKTTRTREAITGLISRGVFGFKEGWLWRTY